MLINSLLDVPASFLKGNMAPLRARGIKFITIDEFADIAGVSAKTLRREQAKGLLPPRFLRHRQFFYRMDEADAWIAKSRFRHATGTAME